MILKSNHFPIRHQRYVTHFNRFVCAALDKAGFGEEVVMHVLVVEQLVALDEQIKYADVNLFVPPLALAEKSGVFICFAHNIDLNLGLGFRIVAPPASERAEFHGALAREKLLPKILLADRLENSAHILGQMRFNALVCQIVRAACDERYELTRISGKPRRKNA